MKIRQREQGGCFLQLKWGGEEKEGEQGAGWAFSPTAIILKWMLERQLRMPPLGTRSELSMGGGDRRG